MIHNEGFVVANKSKPPKKMTPKERLDRSDRDAAAIIGVPVEVVKKALSEGKTLSDVINEKNKS